MSQFDVFKNCGKSKGVAPYLLDIQSDFISTVIGTRLIAPMYYAGEISNPVTLVHVPLIFTAKELVVLFDEITAVRVKVLGPCIGRAPEAYEENFKTALEVMLFNYL